MGRKVAYKRNEYRRPKRVKICLGEEIKLDGREESQWGLEVGVTNAPTFLLFFSSNLKHMKAFEIIILQTHGFHDN